MASDRQRAGEAHRTKARAGTRNETGNKRNIAAAHRSALAFVRVCASDAAAEVFASLLDIRQGDPQRVRFPVADLIAGEDPTDRLRSADQAFKSVFGFSMFVERTRDWELATSDEPDEQPPTVATLSAACQTLFEPTRIRQRPTEPAPKLDASAMDWIDLVVAAARDVHGHHLLIREDEDRRAVGDFADHIASRGVAVIETDNWLGVAATILNGELQDSKAAVVLVGADAFVCSRGDGDDDEPAKSVELTRGAADIAAFLSKQRKVFLWRAPNGGRLDGRVIAAIGGVIGPIGYDRIASSEALATEWPDLGPEACRILNASAREHRDAQGLASMARTAVAADIGDPESICRKLAASVGVKLPPEKRTIDPRLIVCDQAGRALLQPEAAAGLLEGGRVLAHGEPGGGKSSLVALIAERMSIAAGGAPVVSIQAADILARPWGATERLIAALWRDAERSGAILIADEFETFCSVREYEGNNAMLGRTLTNEWLRVLDAHPRVPLLATVNRIDAIDAAVLRRFHLVSEVKDTLSADRELLAWHSIFGMEPPKPWTALGASVSDFAIAAARCRILRLRDAASHAEALAQARRARRGPDPAKGTSVH